MKLFKLHRPLNLKVFYIIYSETFLEYSKRFETLKKKSENKKKNKTRKIIAMSLPK